MSFDLRKTNLGELSEAGQEFQVMLPEINEGTGAFITVRGGQSATVKKFARRKYSEAKHREMVAKKRGKDVEEPSIEELEEMATESAAIRIISWRGFEEDGQVVECTPENVRRILTEHSWIRDQVITESDTLANFIPN